MFDFLPRPSKKGAKPVARKINEFRSGRRFRVGSLEIHPIHVDHSIPGAYGFIISTSAGAVVYTGDVRLHGARPEMTQEFMAEAKAVKPLALICEGTRITDIPREKASKGCSGRETALWRSTLTHCVCRFQFLGHG
ncbi:MAG: hypothetical protein E6K85_09990 [Thaumarchaeota archaeon]|nr:MAG: hypothetical protein E6K85_09990 [Nitrososphaerota archaeon]